MSDKPHAPPKLILRPGADPASIRIEDAMKALRRRRMSSRGMTILRAKQTIETMLADGEVVVQAHILDAYSLACELRRAGIEVFR
jgi:hypothetical protein